MLPGHVACTKLHFMPWFLKDQVTIKWSHLFCSVCVPNQLVRFCFHFWWVKHAGSLLASAKYPETKCYACKIFLKHMHILTSWISPNLSCIYLNSLDLRIQILNFKFKKYSFSNHHSSIIFHSSFLAEILKLGEVFCGAGRSFWWTQKLCDLSKSSIRPDWVPLLCYPEAHIYHLHNFFHLVTIFSMFVYHLHLFT